MKRRTFRFRRRHLLRGLRRGFREPIEAVLFFAARQVVHRVSLDRASRLGGWLGRGPLAWFLFVGRADRNLAAIMPELDRPARRRLARRVTGGLASTLLEYPHTDVLLRETDRIRVVGEGHAVRALAAGGVVFATAHVANPEACRVAIQRLGRAPALYYRPPSNARLRRGIRDILQVIDAPLFRRGTDHPRLIRRHVGEGGAILILVDQRYQGAQRLPFLGRDARTATGPATLARRAGAQLVPVYCRRLPGRRLSYEVRFEAPVVGEDSTAMMRAMNERIGEWVREMPEQWLWIHDRWQ